jgi:hypothetical protein
MGAAKLTAREVRTIRIEFANGGITQTDLAAKYGVAFGTIWKLVHGTQWRDAGGPIVVSTGRGERVFGGATGH